MDECLVEMLLIVNKDTSFGRSPSAYKKIIEASEEVIFSQKHLKFKEQLFNYDISEYGSNKETIFVKLTLCDVNENNLITFSKLTRLFKKISSESNLGSTQIIWDDISKYYSIQAYPLIHEIENLMRKLITKFMIHNVGLSWIKDSVPKEFSEVLKKSEKSIDYNEHNLMYQVDFIDLSDFLFKSYRELEMADLIRTLIPLEFKDVNSDIFSELKKIVPRTNWEKFFESNIDAKSDIIIKNWSILYRLRCKVAHNRDFTKQDLDEVIRLTNILKPILKKAIDKTETLTIDPKEKEELTSQFENEFSNNNKSDEELFKDRVFDLYLHIRHLHQLTHLNSDKIKSYYKIIQTTFQDVLHDEKYKADDVLNLIDISSNDDTLRKLDNFEMNELMTLCYSINELVNFKISSIEAGLDDAEKNNDNV
ncbi:HEPN domain-containing protein [Enterobacter asburiae]|uniref:HEPN domain-containing protein n=1 Tax=Enterobacter asburiae TaxID=61645 RepID=UPI00217582A3|nr:HEPN domain-containing protein [Enterobacter asburiae]MCS5453574.1 HEPN domain-containing protein [Enterobacter asburiae]